MSLTPEKIKVLSTFVSEYTLEHCYISIVERSVNENSWFCCAPVNDTLQTLLQNICRGHITYNPLGI